MPEHYCNEHQMGFFKKGKMKNYAHPIEGTDPVEWCNESNEPEEPALTAKLPPEKRDSSTNASIEAQVAVKAITELWVAGKIKDTDQLVATARNWLMSKLSYWSSQGEAPKPREVIDSDQTEQMIRIDQIEQIKRESQRYKGNVDAYTNVLKDAYGQTNYKKLNTLQAEDLINRLTKGEGLLEELEPEDIPL